jgi:hypothetical protein
MLHRSLSYLILTLTATINKTNICFSPYNTLSLHSKQQSYGKAQYQRTSRIARPVTQAQ